MTGRALLVGAAVGGLKGVENDLDAMEVVLKARGMTIDRVSKQDATRAAVLAAYERLIAAVEPGDAAVFYYSGHGGSTAAPRSSVPGPDLMDVQFIVPIDFPSSEPGDFRGITNVELSLLLARLTRRTDNVTVILDCCHSGRMSRRELRLKSVEPQPYELLREHVDRLRPRMIRDSGPLDPTGNRLAVRIVACAPEQSAFEYAGSDNRPIGLLTESLTLALREAGDERVSWESVLDRVQRRVLALESAQRPNVEGPRRRVVFETEQIDPLDSLRVTDLGGGRVRLEGAALLGVQRDDAFVVMPPGANAKDRGRRVGDLTITGAGSFAAVGELEFTPGHDDVPLGARAYRVSTAAVAMPVLLPEANPNAADLAQAVKDAPLLRAAEAEDRWQARVMIGGDGRLTVEDRTGPLYEPKPGGPAGIAQVIRDLTALARATALRTLTAGARWRLDAPIELEWGLVEDGARRKLPSSGATVRVGTPVYISVRNIGPTPVYVSLVDVGASGKISVLTDFAAEGLNLRPRGEYVFGFEDYEGVLTGIAPTWPDGISTKSARRETVLLLVTARPHDIGPLAQDGVSRGAPDSPLGALFEHITTGRHYQDRDFHRAKDPAALYDVHALDFDLDPAEPHQPPPDGGASRLA